MSKPDHQATGSLGKLFDIITVGGSDARDFLHAQLTCDLRRLSEETSLAGAFLTPKGRVLASMILVASGKQVLLLTHPTVSDTLLQRLRMFVLRSDVTLSRDSGLSVSGALRFRDSDEILLDCLPVKRHAGEITVAWPGGSQLLIGAEPPGAPIDEQWLSRDAVLGIPHVTAATSDRHVAQMLNLDRLRAVSFKKGCYPGQEVVARVHYLGAVKRRLAHYRADAPLEPTSQLIDDAQQPRGEVLYSGEVAGENGHPILAVVATDGASATLHEAETGIALEPALASGEPNIV
ncbi:MAG: hypothetical protein R3200_02670 [Xanthomonadales bacterium]|nr:hypothetical protein [Xanthomonadales bacterium]